MSQILEAEAIIKARDATGRVFENISAKIDKIANASKHVTGFSAGMAGTLERSGRALHAADGVAGKLAGAATGGFAFGKLAQIAHGVTTTYAKFDDLVRYQRAILGLTEKEQKPFIDQAIHGGANSPFNDLQWLAAQLDLAQRGVNKDFIRPITEMASDYAQAMNAELPEAAKTIEGILFSTGKHISDGNEALKVAQRSVDFAVKLAKIGGLDNEDVKAFFKYGGLAGSNAGLSDETTGAMAALMRRANVRGDEAGVAVRAISSKLVAPTQKGRMALMSMGLNYDDYLQTPDFFNAEHLNQALKVKFGKSVSQKSMGNMSTMLADEYVIGERGDFIEKISSALGGMFRRDKKGKMNASDAKSLSHFLDQYYSLGTKNVDSEKLLRDIVGAKPSLQQANALFTDKQGSRFLAVARDSALFLDYIQKLKDTPEGLAKDYGQKRMAGYSGAEKRAEGSWKNVETAAGRAWDTELTAFKNTIAAINTSFVEADVGTQKFVTGVAGAATAIIGFEAAVKAASLIGLLGPGAAGILSRVPLLGLPIAGVIGAGFGANWLGGKVQSYFGDVDIGQRSPYVFSGDGVVPSFMPEVSRYDRAPDNMPKLTLEGIQAALHGTTPQLEGTVTVDINVKNDPSPDFISRITTKVQSWFSGGIRSTGTTGSTGSSMPEAQPGYPTGAPY